METSDLKKTVHLPKTDYPMKANLPQTEPKLLARWKDEDLYGQIRKASAGRPMYVLHDGPPYANGNIHLGTALNKILKDLIVKSKTMAGFDSPYIPGWDCHGLPIEIKVDGQLGAKKAQMTNAQIRRVCREYASKWVDTQRAQFMRLGVFGRWFDPYLTMSAEYQSVIAQAFVDFLEKGYVYKGLKPVNWCIHDRTALAEAEVEYENHASPSIWVRFKLKSDPAAIDPALAGREVYGLIWTTTPWTIPSNMAISYHPKFIYVAVNVNGHVYIVAEDLLKATSEACNWTAPEVVARFEGAVLEKSVFRHPFLDRDSLGILGDHVTLEQGTGAVHTAPGHGAEDYAVGRQYGIEVYCPIDAGGRFYHVEKEPGVLPEVLIGKTVWEANPIVNDLLSHHGALLGQRKIEHSYPHCWRCHKPTIFRATEQWFIGMDRIANGDTTSLRENALASIKKVDWHPKWGEDRIGNMIASRPDWCISRQRVWGVPIVMFYCGDCNTQFSDTKVLSDVVAHFKQHTADYWYDKTAAELLPAGTKCEKCGCSEFRKESDILDVWFDSGSSHLAVLTEKNGLPWPSNMYMEGGDQYRGWFHSSLLIGVGLRGESPYKECATHGWTLDEKGQAMSKSLGNTIEPEDIIKEYGADLVRLWTASVEFTEDVTLSKTILQRLSEAYRKMRNTFRYSLGNLHDFDPIANAVDPAKMLEIDVWILAKMEVLIAEVRAFYAEFAFHRAYRAIYDFTTTELSSLYFDVLKDRLYTAATDSLSRRSGQTALYRVHYALVRLLAPILTFTAEETWTYTTMKPADAPASVHCALFPEPDEVMAGISTEQRTAAANWDKLIAVREPVLKALEEARQAKTIGAPLEAHVTVAANSDLMPLLEQYAADLPGLFIVSEVSLEDGPLAEPVVKVERATGVKCARCWKYTHDTGAVAEYPTVCKSCGEALVEMGVPA